MDLTVGAGLLRQVEGRAGASVATRIDVHDVSWRHMVAFVAIDLCRIFEAAIRQALPNTMIVTDRFHLTQSADQALNGIRRHATTQKRGHEADREQDPHNRPTHPATPTPARPLDPMVDTDLLTLTGPNPPRAEIYRRLERFYASAAASGLSELEHPATSRRGRGCRRHGRLRASPNQPQ